MCELIVRTELPKRGRTRKKDLKALLDEIVYKKAKIIQYIFGPEDYKNSKSAEVNLCRAIKQYGHPLKVHKYGDEIYFERIDM